MPNPTCPHCGTAIEEHEAGRCLDWWVFEAVICDEPLSDASRDALPQAGVPRYSESIAAAWEVVEKHPVGTWAWRLSQGDDRQWRAVVHLGYLTSFRNASIGISTSAPLAICRAAIMAATPSQ